MTRSGAALGWSTLLIGLLCFEYFFNYSIDSNGIGEAFIPFIIAGWSACLIVGALIRRRSLRSPQWPEERSTSRRWMQSWAVPLAILITVGSHHWLSNRLAGAQPAALVHFAVLVAALLASAALNLMHHRLRVPAGSFYRLGLAVAVGLALLVVRDAWHGFDLWSRARAEAAGRPHCVMSWGGWEHRRQALSGWDLSPLVNRHRARWGARTAPVLIVAEGGTVTSYRWRGEFEAYPNQPGSCEPRL